MIFNLFKSKPSLKELIPEGFVDIHSHVLPQIDDGPKDINETLILISKMKELGFSKIIATPHTYKGLYDNTTESIEESFNLAIGKINDDEIIISYSSEYMLDYTLVEKVEKRTILPLKDNYILIEMSFLSEIMNLEEMIFKIKKNGYIPILAHPERYRYLHHNLDLIKKIKKMGCKFQLNLLSTVGYYGKDISRNTDSLLRNNIIDYVGSDIHNIRHVMNFDKKITIKELEKFQEAIENNKRFL